MGTIQYVGALVIHAKAPKKLASWYSKHLGFTVTLEHEDGYYGSYETDRGPFHFGIIPGAADDYISSESSGITITFRVSDFVEQVRQFSKSGLSPIAEAEDEEGHYATFKDPEGNHISIWGD